MKRHDESSRKATRWSKIVLLRGDRLRGIKFTAVGGQIHAYVYPTRNETCTRRRSYSGTSCSPGLSPAYVICLWDDFARFNVKDGRTNSKEPDYLSAHETRPTDEDDNFHLRRTTVCSTNYLLQFPARVSIFPRTAKRTRNSVIARFEPFAIVIKRIQETRDESDVKV